MVLLLLLFLRCFLFGGQVRKKNLYLKLHTFVHGIRDPMVMFWSNDDLAQMPQIARCMNAVENGVPVHPG